MSNDPAVTAVELLLLDLHLHLHAVSDHAELLPAHGETTWLSTLAIAALPGLATGQAIGIKRLPRSDRRSGRHYQAISATARIFPACASHPRQEDNTADL